MQYTINMIESSCGGEGYDQAPGSCNTDAATTFVTKTIR